MKRILIDLDEVCCEWGKKILEWYNADKREECGQLGKEWTDVSLDDITNWDMKTNLGPGSEVYLRSYMRWPGFYQSLEPVPGSIDGVNDLLHAGYDVVIATAIPKCAGLAYEGKKEWLREHMPFFPLKSLVAISRKELLNGDILLDDGLHNLEPFLATDRHAVCMSRPWNAGWMEEAPSSWHPKAHKVRGWSEFLPLVDELSNK